MECSKNINKAQDKYSVYFKILHTMPVASPVKTYQLEQEQIDILFKDVKPYPQPCIRLEAGTVMRERMLKYYENKRGNQID